MLTFSCDGLISRKVNIFQNDIFLFFCIFSINVCTVSSKTDTLIYIENKSYFSKGTIIKRLQNHGLLLTPFSICNPAQLFT